MSTPGTRLFFLAAALSAAVVGGVWVPWFLGLWRVPTAFSLPVWHAHEFMFGTATAMIAGALCLQRAMPRQAIYTLFMLWLTGRLCATVLPEGDLPIVFACTLLFLAAVAVLARRRPAALAVTLGLLVAYALFAWEIWRFGRSVYGGWLGIATLLFWCMPTHRRLSGAPFWGFTLLGAGLAGCAVLYADRICSLAASQAWMMGAIGVAMPVILLRNHLSVAGWAALSCVTVSAGSHVAAVLLPEWVMILAPLAGFFWVEGFLIVFCRITWQSFRISAAQNPV